MFQISHLRTQIQHEVLTNMSSWAWGSEGSGQQHASDQAILTGRGKHHEARV